MKPTTDLLVRRADLSEATIRVEGPARWWVDEQGNPYRIDFWGAGPFIKVGDEMMEILAGKEVADESDGAE